MTLLRLTRSKAAVFTTFRNFPEQHQIEREVALVARGWIMVFLECTGIAWQWQTPVMHVLTSNLHTVGQVSSKYMEENNLNWSSSDSHMFISVRFFWVKTSNTWNFCYKTVAPTCLTVQYWSAKDRPTVLLGVSWRRKWEGVIHSIN